ncbi:MAG: hypothetical protein AB8B60_02105 [Sulfitobacter sp.]
MRLFILPAFLLSACTSIVPATVARLNALSPLEADPAGFAVAMTLPEGVDIAPRSARLMFTVARTDTGEMRDGVFVLERTNADQAIYRIAPQDLPALRELQGIARDWRAEDENATNGSISVTLAPCRIGAGPTEDARASVAIRTDEDGPFLPLVRNGPLTALVDPEKLRDMGDCGAVGQGTP